LDDFRPRKNSKENNLTGDELFCAGDVVVYKKELVTHTAGMHASVISPDRSDAMHKISLEYQL